MFVPLFCVTPVTRSMIPCVYLRTPSYQARPYPTESFQSLEPLTFQPSEKTRTTFDSCVPPPKPGRGVDDDRRAESFFRVNKRTARRCSVHAEHVSAMPAMKLERARTAERGRVQCAFLLFANERFGVRAHGDDRFRE